MVTIGVVKETADCGEPERIVALVPNDAKKLIDLGFKIIIESTAGNLANYTDDDYRKIGAEVATNFKDVIPRSDIVTKVKQWTIKEIAALQRINPFNKKTYLISSFDYGLISLTCVDILLLSNFQIIKTSQNDTISIIGLSYSKSNFQHLLDTAEKIRDNRTSEIEIVNLKEIKKVLDNTIEIYSKYLNNLVKEDDPKVGDFILKDLEIHKVSLSDLAKELLFNCQDIHSAIGIIKNHVLGQYLIELSKSILSQKL
jgi:uncharacterized protein YeeX (DUF496 family)